MSSFLRNIIVWVALGSLMVYVFNSIDNSSAREQISYSQFKEEVLSDRIAKIVYKGDQMTIIGDRLDGSKFETTHPIFKRDEAVENAIEQNGIIAVYEKIEQPSIFSQLLVGAFPIILLLAIFFFFMRQMQGGMSGKGGPMSFGRSKAKLMEGGKVKTTFKDVAGCEEAKQDVQELVDFLKDPTKFQKLGGKIPRGVLMVGPPGTGKTLIARAVAGEAKVPFFTISGSDFVEMFVGVGASRVRDMFDQAKKQSPCIVFIDEIDAVGRHRGAGLGGGHDEREQTLNQILVEMDGFDTSTNVIVLASTNRPDILDPALLRPGRFDRRVTLDNPDIMGRKAILEVHSKGKPLENEVEMEKIAKQTPGFSGADLANLVNEAAILAARRGAKKIGLASLVESIDRVIAGPARKSKVITDEEREITAYHEAGHAVVAHNIPHADPVHKVSIISRGQMGGYTRYLPEKDRYLQTKGQFKAYIASAMGGRIAEKVKFGEITTGASNDIQVATNIAKEMVTTYGMSDKLGLRAYGRKQETVFLGKDGTEQRDYSGKTEELIDKEIDQLLSEGENTAEKILIKHSDQMERLAKYLLEYETIDEDELTKLFAGEEVSPPLVGETLAHSGEQPENISDKKSPPTDIEPQAS